MVAIRHEVGDENRKSDSSRRRGTDSGATARVARSMHHDFWHERWRTGQIGFHQSAVHPFLARWWPTLGVATDARVHVPLCCKSLDMVWLAERGHRVAGSELSPIAIADFFTERGLVPTRTRVGGFVRHAAGPYEILEGDALALDWGALAASVPPAVIEDAGPVSGIGHQYTPAGMGPYTVQWFKFNAYAPRSRYAAWPIRNRVADRLGRCG